MSERIEIKIEDLTLGDMETLEDVAGAAAITDLGKGKVSAKTLVALAYIVKRKADPDFTLDDARALPLVSLDVEMNVSPFAGNGSESSPLSASPTK